MSDTGAKHTLECSEAHFVSNKGNDCNMGQSYVFPTFYGRFLQNMLKGMKRCLK